MQVFEAAQTSSKTFVGADLFDGDALGAYALGDPRGKLRVGLQQQAECADGAGARTITTHAHLGNALVVGHTRVRNERAPAEHAAVFVWCQAVIKQPIDLAAGNPRAGLDLRQCGIGRIQLDRLSTASVSHRLTGGCRRSA